MRAVSISSQHPTHVPFGSSYELCLPVSEAPETKTHQEQSGNVLYDTFHSFEKTLGLESIRSYGALDRYHNEAAVAFVDDRGRAEISVLDILDGFLEKTVKHVANALGLTAADGFKLTKVAGAPVITQSNFDQEVAAQEQSFGYQ